MGARTGLEVVFDVEKGKSRGGAAKMSPLLRLCLSSSPFRPIVVSICICVYTRRHEYMYIVYIYIYIYMYVCIYTSHRR
jgi:hypothetical protein